MDETPVKEFEKARHKKGLGLSPAAFGLIIVLALLALIVALAVSSGKIKTLFSPAESQPGQAIYATTNFLYIRKELESRGFRVVEVTDDYAQIRLIQCSVNLDYRIKEVQLIFTYKPEGHPGIVANSPRDVLRLRPDCRWMKGA